MESVFGHGRTPPLHRPPSRRRSGDGSLPRSRHLAEDKEEGSSAFTDRSRRPVRYANQLPAQIETFIVGCKDDKPHWGARKIRELLVRRFPGDLRMPAKSTIHAGLDRHGLVSRLGRRHNRAQGTSLSLGSQPNDLWCVTLRAISGLATAATATRPRQGVRITPMK